MVGEFHMNLKRLELVGFKSFGQKTELEFQKGITVIVGPNGCGKSNIADSFRWVLGEQSVKSLRGNKMEDVIFNGTSSRKPLSMSSVSLTFNNFDDFLNIDYKEVTVTRRLYRSGESEYLINKTPTRLKDVVDLFLDTGIGKEAYSIISQGKIDFILSNRPEERRSVFEEAAGIIKYKSRKKEAERRLTETQDNILRIGDIITELKEQVSPLKKQAEVAKEYIILKKKLDELVIALLFMEGSNLKKKINRISFNLTTILDSIADQASLIQKEDNSLTSLRWEAEKITEEVQKVQKEIYDIKELNERLRGEVELKKEKINNTNFRLDKNQEEESQFKVNINDLHKQLNDLDEQKKSLVEKTNNLKDNLNKIHLEWDNINIKVGTQDINEIEKKREECLELKYKNEAKKDNIVNTKELLGKKIIELTKQFETFTSYKNKIYEDSVTVKKEMEQIKKEVTKIEKQLNDLEKERNALLTAIKQKEEHIFSFKEESRGIQERYNTLKDLEDSYTGYFQGVRSILKSKKKGVKECQGIHGAVVDLIEVPNKYRLAIETALGSSIQDLIVKDEYTTREAISFLKRNRSGRATFLPLTVIKGNSLNVKEVPECVDGLAVNLIKFNSDYLNIMNQLLGRVFVCCDLQTAQRAAKIVSHRYKIVTLEGDVIFAGGAVTGGFAKKQGVFLLTRKKELEELLHKIAIFKDKINKSFIELEEEKSREKLVIEKLEFVKKERENLISSSLAKEKQMEYIEVDIKNILNKLEETQDAKLYCIKDLEETVNIEIVLKEDLEGLNSQIMIISKELEEGKKILSSNKDLISNLQEEETNIKIQLASKEENLKNISERINDIKKEEVEKDVSLELITQNTNLMKSEKEVLKNELVSKELKLAELEDKEHALANILRELKEKQNSLKIESMGKDEEVRRIRENIQDLKRKEYQYELQQAKLDTEFSILQAKLKENYNLELDNNKLSEKSIGNKAEMQSSIEKNKEEIELLGDVNIGAIEEYERIQKRINFLDEQRNDLLNARLSLTKIISEIDTKMGNKFLETFEQLNKEFSVVFKQLFGGGTAYLELTDNDNPLESGIDIIAKPPGKKMQSITLLSGGEKALTAISLLFSLLTVKPTPFCILDEIDTSLDENNLDKFTKFLKEMGKRTQFIVITHRKQSMQTADILYGVTMEEAGISKIISVRLNEEAS